MTVHPFRIDIQQPVLDDLKERLRRTRWAADTQADDWDRGTNPHYLKQLCAYWRDGFDWQKQQDYLNTFPHFRADAGRYSTSHFIIHDRLPQRPMPSRFSQNKPGPICSRASLKIILQMVDDAFDVIVPSLPGYGFSDKPLKPGLTFDFGKLLHGLMVDVLGYPRFAVHCGDWGGMVAEHLARSYGSSVIGLQMTDVPYYHMFQKPSDPSAAEKKYPRRWRLFSRSDVAPGPPSIQAARGSLSLAQGSERLCRLGLAAWLVEKFQGWSDR